MEKYRNRYCPINDLKHFLKIIKIFKDEDFYLATKDNYGGRNFYNHEIPKELQKRIVCLIEQYIDEVKAGGIDK